MHQQRRGDLWGIDDIEAWLLGPPNLPAISFKITLAKQAGDDALEGGLDVLAGAGEAEGTGGENQGFIAGRPGATDGLEHGLLESLSWVFFDGAAIGVDHAALGEDDAAAGCGSESNVDLFGYECRRSLVAEFADDLVMTAIMASIIVSDHAFNHWDHWSFRV